MKKAAHHLTLILIIIIICLGAGEITIRAFYGRLGNYNMEMWRYASDLKRPLTSPRLPFHHYPNKQGTYYGADVSINSLGFRDREYGAVIPENTKRVILLGDSFTFGWGVSLDALFSKQVEKMLNDSGYACEVINMGIGNYNSTMEVELFKWKGKNLNPDLVVLMYFINDTEPVPPRRSPVSYSIMRSSYFFAFMFDRLVRLRASLAETFEWGAYYRRLYSPDNADNLAMNTASINELVGICRRSDTNLLIVNIPEMHDFENYQFSYATDYIAGLAREGDVPFIDLLPSFSEYVPESLWVSPEDPHASARAHSIIAREIYNRIVSADLLR
jgi:lysophospholipase L1-like esterase